MVDDGDPFDLDKLRLDPATSAAPYVPTKIKKRRQQFVMVPMLWKEKLSKKPLASGATHQVALHLLYLHWKSQGEPFALANGMLKYDGISRFSKWRALADLEKRGLSPIERRHRKSPIIHVHAVTVQP